MNESQKENEESQPNTEDETDEGNGTNTECDQDSDVSFLNDTGEDVDTSDVDPTTHVRRTCQQSMTMED